MAIKGYSAFPKSPVLLQPHHEVFCVISRTLAEEEAYPSVKMQSVYSTALAVFAVWDKMPCCSCFLASTARICSKQFTSSLRPSHVAFFSWRFDKMRLVKLYNSTDMHTVCGSSFFILSTSWNHTIAGRYFLFNRNTYQYCYLCNFARKNIFH